MFDVMDSLRTTFGNLDAVVKNVVDILTMSPESNESIWETVHIVFDVLLPVGYSIATILLLITFINQAILFKLNNYERIVKLFLVFCIGKVVLENSFDLLAWIYSTVASWMTQVGSKTASLGDLVNLDALEAQISQMSFGDRIAFLASSIPTSLIANLINIAVKMFAYGRLIELYVYMALAPIPLATAVSEDHRGIAKSFFQSYIGVCIQGLMMLLCCIMYTGLAIWFKDPTQTGMMSGFGGYLLASITLLFVLAKSGSWAKEIVGLR